MSTSNRVEMTVTAAEAALKELIAEGKKTSQHAVEMRAGLTNGTLNYKCDAYKKFKKRLVELKETSSTENDIHKELKAKIKNEAFLKDKYREERNELRAENQELHGKNKELLHQLFLLQQEMIQMKEAKVVDFNAIRFKRDN